MTKAKDAIQSFILENFTFKKVIYHSAEDLRRLQKEWGFAPYIAVTNKGIKEENEEIKGELCFDLEETWREYKDKLYCYLSSQVIHKNHILIWRNYPEPELTKDGYIIFSRLLVR